MLGHNLGLLGGEPQAVLTALADAAAPGARIIGSGLDPHATTDPDHLRYHEHNRGLGRWPGQARIRIRHGRLATSFFDYLFCSESELAEAVRDSPWRLTGVRRDAGSNYLAIMRLR